MAIETVGDMIEELSRYPRNTKLVTIDRNGILKKVIGSRVVTEPKPITEEPTLTK